MLVFFGLALIVACIGIVVEKGMPKEYASFLGPVAFFSACYLVAGIALIWYGAKHKFP
jgi:hypothetical protein